jgi:cytohesin
MDPLLQIAAFLKEKSAVLNKIKPTTKEDVAKKTPQPVIPKNLVDAVRYDDLPAAKKFIAEGADVNQTVYPKTSALHLAATRDVAFIKLLIEHQANINVEDGNGRIPLDAAAFSGKDEAIKLLIAHGANVNHRNKINGSTILHVAVAGGHAETVRILVAAGAKVDARDSVGQTPLDAARQGGKTEIVAILTGQK